MILFFIVLIRMLKLDNIGKKESRRDMFWEKNEGEVRRGPQGRENK
jgi:hypothetical protein